MDEQRSVVHPRLGRGRLLRTYMGSYLWEVQFDSGRRYRLPSHEFDRDSVAEFAAPGQPFRPAAPVLHDDQFYNRQALEALRVGVVPVQHVEDLTIGLETERLSLERALKRTQEHGGDAVAVIADYGFGKSHFLELTARTALRLNFVVASASLDLVEVPPGKAREIYRALIPSLRYPDHDRRGLRPLLDRALENPAAAAHFTAQRPIEDCPLSMALDALANCPAQQAQ
ncbi:MAG: DUF2791 family P-loop domain-containing protein, partial [Anaerolineae bacterium]|nr:DUF2791 family P-loop domain-containing protein [Anaerolineae bacterium]